MRLLDLPVVRPVLAACVNLLLIAIGLAAVLTLPIREYPDIDPPVVSVSITYRGAPAEVVEREVTKVIEDNLSGLDDLRIVRSTSRDETAQITVEFRTGANLDGAAADVRDRVSAVRRDLPAGIEDPVIEKASADDFPMMYLTLTAERMDTAELTDIADRTMVDAFGTVSGVARVQIGGERRYAMRVWLDREAMAARGVTAGDVANRLRAENLEVPAGRLETQRQEITLRALTRFTRPEEFAALVVREGEGEGRVRLGDVARVEIGIENERTGFRLDGRDAISLGIIRQSDANTLEVAQGVRTELERLRGLLPPGIDVSIGYDESIFISESLWNVGRTLLETVGVIVLVIYLFLGSFRATIIPALTIPASIIPAAAVAAAFGYSINTLTVLAAVLAIGLCVDDAVVILENVRRRQQENREPATLAAARATRQLGTAVFATAAVLLAVIVPLAFLQGNVGRLFREFAVVLAAIVAASTLSAMTIGPMMSAQLFRVFDGKEEQPTRVARWGAAAQDWMAERYRRALDVVLARVWIAPAAGAVLAAAGIAAYLVLPKELAPDEDRGAVSIVIEAPEGSSFPHTAEKVAEVERALADLIGREEGRPIEQSLAILAPGRGGTQGPANNARLILRLKPWDDREASQTELQRTIQSRLSGIPGVRAFAVAPPKLGQRSRGRTVQFVVAGTTRDSVVAWSRTVLERARGTPGFVALDINHKDTKPQIELRLDRDRAAALGVTAGDVGDALGILFGSLEVTRFSDRGEEYEVILQARAEDRRGPDDLANVFVRTRGGVLIPLSAVVTTREVGVARELYRVDRLPAVTIEANLTPALPLGDALDRLDETAREALPGDARIRYLGESLDYRETGNTVVVILGLVLLLSYLVLAAQFESFLHPLVVLTTAPLGVAGGLVTLWAMGMTLNLYSQVAMVLLVGLAAKNGILIVEFANQLRDEGKEPAEAAKEAAAARLRPILMTSVATVIGALPLAIASGAGAEARAILGLVTAGGLTIGTLLTLFVVPSLYVLVARAAAAPGAVEEELRRLEEEHPEGEEGPKPQPAE